MGSRGQYHDEEPIHRVVIQQPYYLGRFVVTQEQYRSVARTLESLRNRAEPSDFKGARRPVEQVDWREANTWCDALTQWVVSTGRMPAGFERFCLPTEAEWEHACRAGSESEYYNGDGESSLAEVAWYSANSGGRTHDVDERPEQHPWGFCGMHGNVWEWCNDVYDEAAYRLRREGIVDPGHKLRRIEWEACPRGEQRRDDDRFRVLRGGSWGNSAWDCRSASRYWLGPVVRLRIFGFRVCLVRGPVPQQAEQPAESEPSTGVGGRGTRPETDGVGGDGAAGGRGEGRGTRGQRTEGRGLKSEAGKQGADDGEGIDLGTVRFPRRGLPDGTGRKEGP